VTPLRIPIFRNLWLAGLLSNLGLMIQGVGAAWLMVELSGSADMVALVQAAQMLPVMIFALVSGAIADMYDRRKVSLLGLAVAFVAAAGLTAVAQAGALTAGTLLAFCFLIGSGMAFLWPAWAASVREQVPARDLPSAVALNSISYNLARSVGPAIGGAIVAGAGVVSAFAATSVLFLPLMLVLYRWRRVQETPRLPREGLGRAVVSGLRYVGNSPTTRIVIVRAVLIGATASALLALLPLVAQGRLGGDARTFGILLGAFGGGAVAGALGIARIRRHFGAEFIIRGSSMILALTTAVVALSSSMLVIGGALLLAGAAFMVTITTFNVALQVTAPRWVTGRALAAFQASLAGGSAIGSWGWGLLAEATTLGSSLLISSAALLVMPVVGLLLPLPPLPDGEADGEIRSLAEPNVRLALTGRSGPVVLEIEYRVDPSAAREFYRLMQDVRASRQRNGGYGWTLSRDIADPLVWIETYACPTWLDYLRQRSRATLADQELYDRARAHTMSEVRIRRRLERPFGSVRWKDETPDDGTDTLVGSPLPGS